MNNSVETMYDDSLGTKQGKNIWYHMLLEIKKIQQNIQMMYYMLLWTLRDFDIFHISYFLQFYE